MIDTKKSPVATRGGDTGASLTNSLRIVTDQSIARNVDNAPLYADRLGGVLDILDLPGCDDEALLARLARLLPVANTLARELRIAEWQAVR